MTDTYKDRVVESTSTTGTGTLSLGGALVGRQPFSVIGQGATCKYVIEDANGVDWESGRGTYNSSTLTRDTVRESTNDGAKINLSAGVHTVFLSPDAQDFSAVANAAELYTGTQDAMVQMATAMIETQRVLLPLIAFP